MNNRLLTLYHNPHMNHGWMAASSYCTSSLCIPYRDRCTHAPTAHIYAMCMIQASMVGAVCVIHVACVLHIPCMPDVHAAVCPTSSQGAGHQYVAQRLPHRPGGSFGKHSPWKLTRSLWLGECTSTQNYRGSGGVFCSYWFWSLRFCLAIEAFGLRCVGKLK